MTSDPALYEGARDQYLTEARYRPSAGAVGGAPVRERAFRIFLRSVGERRP